MSKVLLFFFLTWITGSPIVAIVLLLVLLYFLDRRFIGLTPNVFRPIQRSRRLAKLRQELRLSPHNNSTKLEIARILMERKQYADAAGMLEQVAEVMDDSAEVRAELGICRLKLGQIEQGKRLILEAFDLNPRVKYGEPYLRLAEAVAERDPDEAIGYLEKFSSVNSSSCEAYYRLGQLYHRLGRQTEAQRAFRETVELYRGLPKYKRRVERRWALLARLKLTGGASAR
ncbi:tetratricopeptide repeat protein [Paenibacillus xerothermodurans]|uniref:Tetratricopeptide repeat protein n=1 Tax=Paenibacillus xerothermodurans TaxID=1977292 RepID=A0A2W1NZW7_PAEXE|nr:tetratricopeptide repeat protein [Paenibacillus xerothermodurans]PZE21022.1 tetratricopeptide repeat protein [Paenibacillus xerothermodurans]